MRYQRKTEKNEISNNNRLNLMMAIIFLLASAIIFRLYNLQVAKYDLYVALASDQHLVYNKLIPERGRIYMQDSQKEGGDLYQVAINKEFALVYAVPQDIEDPRGASEKLYSIFDEENVVKEVDLLIKSDDYFSTSTNLEYRELLNTRIATMEMINEFKKLKKEQEIEKRKKEIIEAYVEKLSKKNDPYEPIRRKVDEDKLKKVLEQEIEGIDYIMEKHRFYPELGVGSQVLGFVGEGEDGPRGRYGLEGFFDKELSGVAGSVRAERSASGDIIIINDREYKKEENGSDLVLTINRSIQYEVCKKIKEKSLHYGAESGTVIVMEPKTGAIIAMCSWPDYDSNNYNEVKDINVYNNPAIFDQYEPGSIFKSITMTAGIDQGKVNTHTTYFDKGSIMIEGWPKPIKNSDFETHGGHGEVDMVTVLEASLNTGAIYVMEKTGPEIFAEYVKNYGFGEKTGIEMETEGVSNIRSLTSKSIRPVEAATASFGQGITVTPLQMITAYAAIANGGILMKPYLVSEIVSPNGDIQRTAPTQIRRVISEKTSLLVSGMMVNVVDDGHAKKAGVKGYYVAGKTGTAQVASNDERGYSDKTIHTFVGFGPVDDPKFVMLVKIDKPANVKYAADSAAPTFGELSEFILNYYQIEKKR